MTKIINLTTHHLRIHRAKMDTPGSSKIRLGDAQVDMCLR